MLLEFMAGAGVCFMLDQAAKMLVARRLAPGQSVAVTSWLRLRRVANARGLPLFRLPWLQLLGLAVLSGGICLVIRHGCFFQHPAAQLGLGLGVGGACSNICDQLRTGAVLDFLDLGWWPVFNLADVAITLGVIIALGFLY